MSRYPHRPCPVCRAPDGFHDDRPHAAREVAMTRVYTPRREPTGRTRHETGEPVLRVVWRRYDGRPLPHLLRSPDGARPGARVRVWSAGPAYGRVGEVVGMETVDGWPNVVALVVEALNRAAVRATAWEVVP